MDPERAQWLTSAEGLRALASLAPVLATMPLGKRADALRRDFAPWQASALSEQVDLRARAESRFGKPPLSLYTASGLEMMTHPSVAARRASRLAAHGLPVADLTCGIGGDLAAMAPLSHACVGLDSDLASIVIARHNVLGVDVVLGDATTPPFRVADLAVLLDPARRGGITRHFNPAAFSPAWDRCLVIATEARVGAVKGPPGLPPTAIPPNAEVEFVQFGRSMRESALYFGGDARSGVRRAVVLPANAVLENSAIEAPAEAVDLDKVIFDPASAVTLAGLVRHLGHILGARLIDSHLGYLTAPAPVPTPFADAFEVIDVVPFSIARVKKRLQELSLRAHEIRRRAFPIEPDELRRLLGPQSGDPATLLCCTIAGKRQIILARPVQPAAEAQMHRPLDNKE